MSTEISYVPIHSDEGIAKVFEQIVELYKVCENKELIDKVLESYIAPGGIITTNGKTIHSWLETKV
jgi:hypothetical protein